MGVYIVGALAIPSDAKSKMFLGAALIVSAMFLTSYVAHVVHHYTARFKRLKDYLDKLDEAPCEWFDEHRKVVWSWYGEGTRFYCFLILLLFFTSLVISTAKFLG